MTNPFIVRPITEDGMVGYDEFNQLTLGWQEHPGSISYRFIEDVRDLKCPICLQGWQPTAASMRDQIRWSVIEQWVHATCFFRHLGFVERTDFYFAIVYAKLAFYGLTPIENQYWPKPYEESGKPWYEAKLIDYPVKLTIGQRKRVTAISLRPEPGWTFLSSRICDAFIHEDVTKEFGPDHVLVHAWTREKVRAYLEWLAVQLRGGCCVESTA